MYPTLFNAAWYIGLTAINMALPFASATQFEYGDDTAFLILKLQLEDTDQLLDKAKSKGKGKEGTVTDQEVALQMAKAELERTQ